MSSHLVSTEWLAERFADATVRIVDVRGQLSWEDRDKGAPWRSGKGDFDAAHIPGAVHLDFASELVDLDDPVPLQVAPFDKLERVLGEKGIGDDRLVVVYDADRSIFATRLWWIFRLCGHSNIRVLDGGWPKWRREGRPVSACTPNYPSETFTINARPDCRSDVDQVRRSSGRPDSTILLDARASEDFLGKPKWADRGGHIPGAMNLPASSLLRVDGTFKPITELGAIVNSRNLSAKSRVITYCGLGLAATSVAFVLDMLGFRNVSVFDGSWAEWGSRRDLPAA